MTIVDVKSAKDGRAKKQEFDPKVLSESGHENLSRTPLYVGLSIASLLIYLKTAMGAQAGTIDGQVDSLSPDGADGPRDDSLSDSSKTPHDLPEQNAMPTPQFHALGALKHSQTDRIAIPAPETIEAWQTAGAFAVPFASGPSKNSASPQIFYGAIGSVVSNDNGRLSANQPQMRVPSGDEPLAPRPNRRPVVTEAVTLNDGFTAMAVMIGMSDLLKGASDADGDELYAINLKASSGQVIQVDGGYMFIGSDTGDVTFTYDVTDGKSLVTQTATINVTTHSAIEGTIKGDSLTGTDGADFIKSYEGNDKILAGDGVDTVYAGDGNDEIHGGAGNDLLVAGAGNDVIYGDDGNDLIFAGAGDDIVHGGAGNDLIHGDAGNDIIFGDQGDDTLVGDAGNDELHDGAGKDTVLAGEGNDRVVAAADSENDHLEGGAGIDEVNYADSNAAVTFDIGAETAKGADIGSDSVVGFEVFVGGAGGVTFVAAGGEAAKEDQKFVGGTGQDKIDYSDANNALDINLATGEASGEDIGHDSLTDVEHVVAGAGDDHITLAGDGYIVDGGLGNDIFEILANQSTVGTPLNVTIEDFAIGDVVKMSSYDIFEQDDGKSFLEQMIASGMDQVANADSHIHFHFDDKHDFTSIESDFDGDGIIDITVELDGHHHLMLNYNLSA